MHISVILFKYLKLAHAKFTQLSVVQSWREARILLAWSRFAGSKYPTTNFINIYDIPKRNLRFPANQVSWVIEWVNDWVIEYAIFLHAWPSSPVEGATETKFSTKVAQGWGWCPNVEYAHSAEKARDTTLNDEKYDVRYRDRWRPIGKHISDGT